MRKRIFLIAIILITSIALSFGIGFGIWTIASQNHGSSEGDFEGYTIIDLDNISKSTPAFYYNEAGFYDETTDQYSYNTTFTIKINATQKDDSYDLVLSLMSEDNFLSSATITSSSNRNNEAGNDVIRIEQIEEDTNFEITYTITSTESDYSSLVSDLKKNKKVFLHITAETKDGAWSVDKEISLVANVKQLIPIDIPTAKTDLVYNKTEQTLVNPGTGYTLTNDKQTNAGNYTVTATLQPGYCWSDNSITQKNISASIAKKTVTLNALIEMNYDASVRTWAQFQNSCASLISAEGVIEGDSLSVALVGMHNGHYKYGTISDSSYTLVTPSSQTEFGSSYNNVIGSTYIGSFSISNSNYVLETNKNTLIKYKTALIGSKYYTIEDAISSTGNITFSGDSTNSNSYITTSFTRLDVSYTGYSSNSNFLINGRTVVVNYQSGFSVDFGTSTTVSNGFVFSTLYIPSGIGLTISADSTLVVNGILCYTQVNKDANTSATSNRGVVFNNGVINVNGKVNCYGYIKGNGIVNCNSQSEITDLFVTFDWPGGNTAQKLYSTCVPHNAWSIHAISCKTFINYGSKYYAYYLGYETTIKSKALVVTNSTSDNGIFVIKNANSYIIKETLDYGNGNNLLSIVGLNRIKGQKDIISLYGDFEDSKLSINIYSSLSMNTSPSIACPIGYMDIYVKGFDYYTNDIINSKFTLSKCDLLFLPGTKLEIEPNATFETAKSCDLFFETYDHIKYVDPTSTSDPKTNIMSSFGQYHCMSNNDAYCLVNGTLDCKSKVAGLIKTSSTSGIFKTSTDFGPSTFKIMKVGVGASGKGYMSYTITDMYSYGYIDSNDTISEFMASETYYSSGEYWNGGSFQNQTNYKGVYSSTDKQASACLLPNTLVAMADGTFKEIQYIESGEMVVVFNHETGMLDVAPVIFNESEEEQWFNVIHLVFDNGSNIGVISEHGFFDLDTMRYEYIDETNYQNFIGHRFYRMDGSITILIDAYVQEEYIMCYSFPTYYHLNFFTDDILSMPGGIEGLFNIFEYADNLQYDQDKMIEDINTYGLFTVEEFAPYGVTEEMFYAYGGQYLKVALGKGILTEEYLMYLIERYGKYTE